MPKPLSRQSKALIASLISYFEKERDNNATLLPLKAVRERVADALNIHISTVNKISSMTKQGIIPSSPKKKRVKKKPVVNIDDFNQCAIRNKVYNMYRDKEHITLCTLNNVLKRSDIFNGCTTSLWKVLRNIGFHFTKDDPKRALMELPHIALKRISFLQQYIRIKQEHIYQFIFLDETWIFQDGSTSRTWQDEHVKTVKAKQIGGKRYIILHAGNEDGFIPGAELIFTSNNKNSDYHGDMNRDNFLFWLENQLLRNLENPSVIVMDNASYHSTIKNKPPTSSTTKLEITNWLNANSIDYDASALKLQLLDLVERFKPPPIYEADELANKYGHVVLRLPPYHCIFNPIELIWGISKRYYNNHIGKYGRTEEGCIKLWKEALSEVTPTCWANSIKHTETEIKKWWDREIGFEREDVRPLVINIGAEESSTDDSDFE